MNWILKQKMDKLNNKTLDEKEFDIPDTDDETLKKMAVYSSGATLEKFLKAVDYVKEEKFIEDLEESLHEIKESLDGKRKLKSLKQFLDEIKD